MYDGSKNTNQSVNCLRVRLLLVLYLLSIAEFDSYLKSLNDVGTSKFFHGNVVLRNGKLS